MTRSGGRAPTHTEDSEIWGTNIPISTDRLAGVALPANVSLKLTSGRDCGQFLESCNFPAT